MTDDGTSAPEEPDGPAVAASGADARHPGALGRHLLRPVVGQVAGRAMRFGAGFGRSLTVRRALQASSRVQAGDAGHKVVRAPRWWRPTSEPVGPDATGGAASLPPGADQDVAVVAPSLPDRGLRRAARPVQTDPSRLPGGTSVNAVPQTVPMRLPKEVAAAGRMLTPIDRRRRSPGPPAAPDSRGGPSGKASGTGTTPDVARRGTSAGSSEQAVRRTGAGTSGGAPSPTGRPAGDGTPGPAAPPTGSRYVRRRRAATSVARSAHADGATGRAVPAARQAVGRGTAPAAGPAGGRPGAAVLRTRGHGPAVAGPATGQPGAATGPGSGTGPDAASGPGTTLGPAAASASGAASAVAPADASRDGAAVIAGGPEGRPTPGRLLAPLNAATTAELGGARLAERTAQPLRRALGVPVRLRVHGGAAGAVGATLPGGVRLRPHDKEPATTSTPRATAPAAGREAASTVRRVPVTAAGSSPVPGGAAPASVHGSSSPIGASVTSPGVASSTTRGAVSSAAADASAGTVAARPAAASHVPATAAVRRAAVGGPEDGAGGATPGGSPAPDGSSVPEVTRRAEVQGTPSVTTPGSSAGAAAAASGPAGIHAAGAAEPAVPAGAGGATSDLGTGTPGVELPAGRHRAGSVAAVRRYSGLPLAMEALAGRRAAHAELGVPAAGAGRSVRPAGLVQRRTETSDAPGAVVGPVAGAAGSLDRRGAGSVRRSPVTAGSSVATQARVPAETARRGSGTPAPSSVGLPGAGAVAGRVAEAVGPGSSVPGRGSAGRSRAASRAGFPRSTSGSAGHLGSGVLPGLASGFAPGLASGLVSGVGPAAQAGAGYADVRRTPSAVAPPAWTWGVVGPSSSGPAAPKGPRSGTGRAPGRATALDRHHAAGAAPWGPGAGPAAHGTVASAPGAPLRRTRTTGGGRRLLGLHRGATPPVELSDVPTASARTVVPPRAAPALAQPGLPGAEPPAAPGFVRTTPTGAADPSAARRGPTIGASRVPVPGVPATLSGLLAAEAAGRFVAPGAVPSVGADPLQAVGRTIEGAVMSQSAPGTRISRSWSAPGEPMSGDPAAGTLTPEQLDDLVDRVVERIEDRVVEELERRGRRRMPGVF